MSKLKKIGIILILFGIGLPLISLAFASHPPYTGYYSYDFRTYIPAFGLIGNIQRMEIVIREGKEREGFTVEGERFVFDDKKEKIAIPYRYVFATGIILVFTGIGITVLSNNRRSGVNQ